MAAFVYSLGWLAVLVSVWIAVRCVLDRSQRRLSKYIMWWARHDTAHKVSARSKMRVFGVVDMDGLQLVRPPSGAPLVGRLVGK